MSDIWEMHTGEHDGTLNPDCKACEAISKYPCQWCGYGHIFYSHSLLAHSENDDPICQEGGFGENTFIDRMLTSPWRDWWSVKEAHSILT